ncbi:MULTISPECIES: hypothetical protein [Flavobacterium]|jgi:hypothetical protein|uniref:Fibronectin type-III domain-containing protein n=1 Tax=Flavobacterium cupriresistens TaxID=2893885 RepID=A0ABU4RFC2_9FLAO|nr:MULTISPECIES: hypothetical protein [unclassified Flavobacterium]KLT68388.1 hypothetical protein AB674_18335 [Flavobacterium sp. ABG]MDX6191309.1 hypothetical protein [Flavobacterium sp. Fl-318]UFH42373.1 hypothetical protein LNP23_21520 [Flavobacterium sp. F-323]
MKTTNKIILVLLSFLTYSCEDILEEDISDDTVQILSPTNNSEIESNVVSFKWNSLKGSDKYRIQVYGSDQILILDSLTTKTAITLPLEAGDYVWRVRGENYAYESIYSFPSNFSTTISKDLSNQQVILKSPENDKFVNFINVTLHWDALNYASSYNVKVVNTVTGREVYSNPNITDTSITLNLLTLEDGNYEWRLKAKNIDSETKQYAARKFNIDTTNPNQPKNILPADNSTQTINSSMNYTWSIPNDVGSAKSPISYIVEFSNDVDFNIIMLTQNSDSTTLQQSFSTAGVYYWRIRAIDGAGNVGPNSTKFKFTVK